jgi:abequosyltransferase
LSQFDLSAARLTSPNSKKIIPQAPFISVCIPAYGRAHLLPSLLDSIVSQDFDDFEVVLCENDSPERQEIRGTVERYQHASGRSIRYFENEHNLGYDGNIRRLVQRATGRYLCFCGNDDLLAPGALRRLAKALEQQPGVGVVLRTYATFRNTPDQIDQVFRYFGEERVFPPGADTIVTFFKRCVVIPGVTFERKAALEWETDQFDGYTLYQIWLVANILVDKKGIYLPEVVAHYRLDGIPDIGHSDAERTGNYIPGIRTPESSLFMMSGFLKIAQHVEATRGVKIRDAIERDLANYSFGFIVIQRSQPLRVFFAYVRDLARLGYGKHLMFWVYVVGVTLLPERVLWRIMGRVKRALGRTPNIGGVYQGLAK